MYTKEIVDLRDEVFELTPENRFHIAKFLSGWGFDFKIISNGNWTFWKPGELVKSDKWPTVYFYNGKFWNKPQKTPAEIGKCLKDTNTAKLHERIAQLEKQLSIKSLEVENLEVRLNRALNEIGRLTIE